MRDLVWADDLTAERADAVRHLLLAAREADGRPDIEPDGPLPGEFRGPRHLLGFAPDGGGTTSGTESAPPGAGGTDVLVAYGHLDTAGDAFGRRVAELIVHPGHRGRGHGAALLDALVQQAPSGLRVWAHGDHPAAARLASRFEMTRARELLVMRAFGAEQEWPPPRLPDGMTLRTFETGRDERAVVEVNARAFDWHPEQGALDVAQLEATERESWFDPDGFFLAEDADGRLAGFHWTKIHPPNPRRFGGEAVGEVYVVGVDPAAQGGGLGKALTLAGLRYLRERGLRQVVLYVEGDNAPAVAVYRRLGFDTAETDVQYALDPPA
ncbi:mycothiol synthase [Saccharomonospora saliphila]|uniref:mycothiol synthase n=1 Tax=Saccharomonospora saliphila TaxID=369829 RepID=UPI000380CB9C|nr:mycothiol synthase [Saccharomonospora saliphila]